VPRKGAAVLPPGGPGGKDIKVEPAVGKPSGNCSLPGFQERYNILAATGVKGKVLESKAVCQPCSKGCASIRVGTVSLNIDLGNPSQLHILQNSEMAKYKWFMIEFIACIVMDQTWELRLEPPNWTGNMRGKPIFLLIKKSKPINI